MDQVDTNDRAAQPTAEELERIESRLQAKLNALDIEREVAERFGYGFRHSAIPMMVSTIMGELVVANECFWKTLGREAPDQANLDLNAVLHPDDQQLSHGWGLEAVLERRDEFAINLRYAHADGHWVHFAVTSKAVRDDEGDALYFFTQLLDVTDLKDAQHQLAERASDLESANDRLVEANAQLADANEQLAETARAKTRFLATTTHDLRNPLTVIHGFASMLASAPNLDDKTRQRYVDLILQQTGRIDRMMEELLMVSRLDSGQVAARPESTNVAELAERVVESMTEHDEVDIAVHAPRQAMAHVDPAHLERVLSNLISNALKYGAAPYEVHVIASGSGAVTAEVVDCGPGVPDEFIADLFEPFSRAAAQSTVKGTGLGLAIVRGLAKAWDGDVVYERRGQQTVFAVQIPAPVDKTNPEI